MNPGEASSEQPQEEPQEEQHQQEHQLEESPDQQEAQQHQEEEGAWATGDIVEEEAVVVARARGLYEYVATNDTELSFQEGEIMNITDQDDSGWWFAEVGERSGFVPKNYLEVVEQF